MRVPLSELVHTAADGELCATASERVVERYGDEAPARTMPEPFFTLVAVYTTAGIVRGGGFQVLFECELPGDPTYSETLAAFDRVGCRPAFEAFQRALALFPRFDPHADADVRGAYYDTLDDAVKDPIDRAFRAAGAALTSSLAAYVRAHAARFAGLDDGAGGMGQ
jgi:hypothetical protein